MTDVPTVSGDIPFVDATQASNAFGGGLEAAAGDPTVTEVTPQDVALVTQALAKLQDHEVRPGVFVSVDDPAASLLQELLVERAMETGEHEPSAIGGREAKFDVDIGWIRAVIPKLREKLRLQKRVDRPPVADQGTALPADARIAILGDFGTGLYGAPAAHASIERDGGYDAALHVGDIYYTGTEREVDSRFLGHWPDPAEVLSRACNANHEMYSAGVGYFGRILPAFEQPSSVFLLENDRWLFVGLDSAWENHDIDHEQLRWLDSVLARRADRKLVLFTHHQPWSHFNDGGGLVAALQVPLRDRAIFAWYWGHEHRAVFYDAHPTFGVHGRCIGHSGYPYRRRRFGDDVPSHPQGEGMVFRRLAANAETPAALVLDGENEFLGDDRHKFGPNGYLRLELDGDTLQETLLTAHGDPIWSGSLP